MRYAELNFIKMAHFQLLRDRNIQVFVRRCESSVYDFHGIIVFKN